MEGTKDHIIQQLARVVIHALEWDIGSPADPGWRRMALNVMDEVGYYDCLSTNATNPFWNGVRTTN